MSHAMRGHGTKLDGGESRQLAGDQANCIPPPHPPPSLLAAAASPKEEQMLILLMRFPIVSLAR